MTLAKQSRVGRMKDSPAIKRWTLLQIRRNKRYAFDAIENMQSEKMHPLFAIKANRFVYYCYPQGYSESWYGAAKTWMDAPVKNDYTQLKFLFDV